MIEKAENVSKLSAKGSGIKILIGTGSAFVITIISLLLISILLTYTNVSENIYNSISYYYFSTKYFNWKCN